LSQRYFYSVRKSIFSAASKRYLLPPVVKLKTVRSSTHKPGEESSQVLDIRCNLISGASMAQGLDAELMAAVAILDL